MDFIMNLKNFLREETAQSEWNSIYMLLIIIIAALLLIALVKPMFKQSQTIVKNVESGVKSG